MRPAHDSFSPPKAAFEPIQEIHLVYFTHKVAFLVAVTSVRQVSELAALSYRKLASPNEDIRLPFL